MARRVGKNRDIPLVATFLAPLQSHGPFAPCDLHTYDTTN